MALPTSDKVQRVINHVFLPPRLPQSEDDDSTDRSLVQVTLSALMTIRNNVPPEALPGPIADSIAAISSINQINSLAGARTDDRELHRALLSLSKFQTLATKISSQNAGVIITKRETDLIFETFELSPSNKDVISTKGRIIREFPANATAVDASLLNKVDFTTMIARTLSTMCQQPVKEMVPQTTKAGRSHDEGRDTNSPAMVSELFVGMLKGIGHSVPVSAISKKMRDEVLWSNAKAPWRRSPMWVLIRVTLQLVLTRSAGGSRHLYKVVMLTIMGHILHFASRVPMEADILHIMNAKIARRLQKLSRASLDPLSKSILDSVATLTRDAAELISKEWDKIQKLDTRDLDLSALSTLNFEKDSIIEIPSLDKHIRGLSARQHSADSSSFVPNSGLVKFADSELPKLPLRLPSDAYYAAACLQSFEDWVALHLSTWQDEYNSVDACEKLADLLSRYHALACEFYAINPEAKSVTILTIFELWVACDKAATRICPLLEKYDPGIPTDALQNLLLPFAEQMQRLSRIEAYLDGRVQRSSRKPSTLFVNSRPESFPAQYYDQSDLHQSLRSAIEADAVAKRQQKREELQKSRTEFNRLEALCGRTEHTYETRIIDDDWLDPPETELVHVAPYACSRCQYERQRDALSINVHEWPLPKNDVESKTVVFELQLPTWFSFWRSSRFFLMQDVLKWTHTAASPTTQYKLDSNDPHLTKKYFKQKGARRIGLLSETKPVCVTHYKSKAIATLSESDICVDNGLNYRYYDNSSQRYLGELAYKPDIPRACTYTLPHPELQKYIVRPASHPDGPNHNAVIASQDTCPASMTLQEFAELSAIPLGHHIQWANISLQLAMPGVDFKKTVTALVILQCAYQAGPPGAMHAVLREAHDIFNDDVKVDLMVDNLINALQRVKENWESAQALSTFVAIAARIISLNSHATNRSRAFLEDSRRLSAHWIQSLREKAYAATDHKDRTAFVNKAVEVALICIATFDVDQTHLESILNVPSNVSILIQASIVVHEGEHMQSAAENTRLSLLYFRFKRLLFRSYKLLAKNCTGINDAIKESWAGYVPGSRGWQIVSSEADNWLSTETAGVEGVRMKVHYNLLSGELLVNGLPLDQPSKEYRDDPLYSTLFGQAVDEVLPASSSGFQFSTKRAFGGCQVQLGMSSTGDNSKHELIVQAKIEGTNWESVPSSLFTGVFPSHFVRDFVHWYNHETGALSFLLAKDPWNYASTDKWALTRPSSRSGWQLTNAKDGRSLIGLGCQTSTAIGRILAPMTYESNVHNTVQSSGSVLEVDVPHLRRGFLLRLGSSSLQSKDFRSMEIDPNQFLGTFIGFNNKIILKSKAGKRLVLILESDVSYKRQGSHVAVLASKEISANVNVHALQIDDLGRLLDNSDLGCKLYMAYVHALTSFCLPDPLTGSTGTEQALSLLRSASMRSFERLSTEQVALLGKIASLSPGRCYYPKYERVMQTIDWDDRLSCLSQHGGLNTAVNEIFQQAEQGQRIESGTSFKRPRSKLIEEDLKERDSIRTSAFRIPGFGAEDHTIVHDKIYSSRDQNSGSSRSTNSAAMACLFLRDSSNPHWEPQATGRVWKMMCAAGQVQGYEVPIDEQELAYDGKMVQNGLDYVATRLPALIRWMNITQNPRQHKFSIAMWLSTMAFSEKTSMSDLQLIAMLPKLRIGFPQEIAAVDAFQPAVGTTCNLKALTSIVNENRRAFELYPEYNIARQRNERLKAYQTRRDGSCRSARDAAAANLIDYLFNQWPAKSINAPDFDVSKYIQVETVMGMARKKFETWHNNARLHQAVSRLESALSALPIQRVQIQNQTAQSLAIPESVPGFTSEVELFTTHTPPQLPGNSTSLTPPEFGHRALHGSSRESAPLGSLVERLWTAAGELFTQTPPLLLRSLVERLRTAASNSKYEKNYVEDLQQSLNALAARDAGNPDVSELDTSFYSQHLRECRDYVDVIYNLLRSAVSSDSTAPAAQSLPRVSPILFLRQLSHTRWRTLSDDWRSCIVRYGLALTAMQRADRLQQLSLTSRREDLLNELQNPGHKNWDPMEYPESLLIEVESAITIRAVQEEVARQMRQPTSNANSVMQLNMGEGKSSVIVPITAASLADGSQLVRVIVAKPQSKQMAQMLIAKLGGLVDRRVYYLPFSRSLKLDNAAAVTVASILEECKSNGGILLVQPEHILSFQLMVPECYITGKESIGRSLMETQDFLDTYSRDIVDESDENFSVRFELIYTMGMQRSVELSPDRWLLLQQILDLVRHVAVAVAQGLPTSLEVIQGVAGSFPRVRILRSDAEMALVRAVAAHVCENGLDGFRLSHQPDTVRKAVYTYITKSELNVDEIRAVENGVFWTGSTQSVLLLLRGIIAGGVLAFTLGQKRWRVNYGTAKRTPPTKLAVPYRAKDSPSPRSEFSHPDVLITLTSLCYYYGGLTDDDLFVALGHLMDSDQADVEYQSWVKDANGLPSAFKQLQGINLKDRPHCVSKLFPALRYGKSVVDYFLSHHVFPKEMKEFPDKLSASGWDLGKHKGRLTTGFSGTNDSRCLLPIDVGHLDLKQQKHTNALVLEYLLRPENTVKLMTRSSQHSSDAADLLETVSQLSPPVEVILDVGAQILELNNSEVATIWLQRHNSSKEAAVFVNDSDELCVVDRHGRTDLLQTSSFAARLDLCLIFLDEAHTRGIDLKLPPTYRAALTLGAHLTKDRLVQAAMRMRKLGKGQAIVFVVPQEIHFKILECTSKPVISEITVEDVLFWSISETHAEVRRSMPLWSVQGERFVRQDKLWKALHHNGKTAMSKEHSEKFLEAEAQTLEDRYRPRPSSSKPLHLTNTADPHLKRIADHCANFDDLQFNSRTLQEEQERELSPEIEQERQVERAPAAKRAAHDMHPDVRTFATTGTLVSGSTAYMPAFDALRDCTAAQGESFTVSQLAQGRNLLVTVDFARTVRKSGGSYVSDTFQRSVQWILTNRRGTSATIDCILIISPHEANELYTTMKTASSTALHVYKPRSNSGYRPLDELDFWTVSAQSVPPNVPRSLAVQLNLFAGQLYLSSYEDYLEICKFLGLSTRAMTNEMSMEGWELDANGFILRDGEGQVGGSSGLKKSPVNFFKILMSKIRRNGDSISRTHMGRLLEGKIFSEDELIE